MLGIRLKNISADVIFCVWGQYKVPHRLQIMFQSFVTAVSPQPLSRTGISIAW